MWMFLRNGIGGLAFFLIEEGSIVEGAWRDGRFDVGNITDAMAFGGSVTAMLFVDPRRATRDAAHDELAKQVQGSARRVTGDAPWNTAGLFPEPVDVARERAWSDGNVVHGKPERIGPREEDPPLERRPTGRV
jgi:hypothetical protein